MSYNHRQILQVVVLLLLYEKERCLLFDLGVRCTTEPSSATYHQTFVAQKVIAPQQNTSITHYREEPGSMLTTASSKSFIAGRIVYTGIK